MRIVENTTYTPVDFLLKIKIIVASQNLPFLKIFIWKEIIKNTRSWQILIMGIESMPIMSYTLLLSTFKLWTLLDH